MADGSPAPSPIAAELEALLGMGMQWLRSVLPEDHIATGAPECVGCPVCRLVRAIRSEESEIAASVAAGVDSAVTAVNAILMLLRAHGEPAAAESQPDEPRDGAS